MIQLTVVEHPLLDLRAFVAEYPQPLGAYAAVDAVVRLFDIDATSPFETDDKLRRQVRDLLRVGGFKPTGRSKPASEYLRKAAEAARLGPINIAVDTINAVSLHSGLPISVIDLKTATAPFCVSIAPPDSNYVFNAAGQSIDVGGLLCLFDSQGPCGNAVKDSQRTKTSGQTTRTLTVVWGTMEAPGLADRVERWQRELLAEQGVATQDVEIEQFSDS